MSTESAAEYFRGRFIEDIIDLENGDDPDPEEQPSA